MWVHFDTYGTSKQFGVDIANNYVYFETLSNGAVKIRHTGDGGSTSSNTSLDDGNWHHVALSRTNDTLYGFVDGTAVVNDNGGTSGNSVSANSKFNFWGADNNFTSYNIDGQIIDAFIYIGKGVSSYTNPTAPLVGNDGTINHFSGFTDSDAYYISPCVDITGSSANSLSGFFKEVAGASTGAATNFNPFNTDINIVRGQETGYPTWNPLRVSGQTLSNNNMTTTGTSGNVLGSMFTPTSGKFYWEVTAGSDYTMTGIQRENNYDMSYPGNSTGQIAMYLNTGVGSGQLYNGGTITSSWGGGVTGDIIGVALDMDNNKVYFYNNGRGLGAGGITGTPEAVNVPTGGGYTANCRSGSGAYDGTIYN